jgi:hypothetical protein
MALIRIHDFSALELERFRHYQRLSYEILDATAKDLCAGVSEDE